MLLNNYLKLKQETSLLILLIIFSFLVRIPIIVILGDTTIDNEWETLQNKINTLQQKSKSGDKKTKIQLSLSIALLERLNNFQTLISKDRSIEELHMINELNLLTNKPKLYVCNVDETSIIKGNNFSDLVQEKSKREGNQLVLVSALIESQITQFETEKDKLELLDELQLKETALNKVINSGYNL